MDKKQFLINKAKSFFLISGLHGVALAKSQWSTIKKCLKRTKRFGETKLESSDSQSTQKHQLWRRTLKKKGGPRLSIINALRKAVLRQTTAFEVFQTCCLSTRMVKLFLSDTPQKETWKKISTYFSKGKNYLSLKTKQKMREKHLRPFNKLHLTKQSQSLSLIRKHLWNKTNLVNMKEPF